MSDANILTLTETNFPQEVLKSTVPVLVDFWAEWCGPCKMIAPILDELAVDYGARLRIERQNIDAARAWAAEYAIRAIPTLLIFKDGQVTDQIVGLRSKRDFKTKLDRVTG